MIETEWESDKCTRLWERKLQSLSLCCESVQPHSSIWGVAVSLAGPWAPAGEATISTELTGHSEPGEARQLPHVLRDNPHGNACVCVLHRFGRSSCRCTFLKPGLRVEKLENSAHVFSCRQQICILCVSMTPSRRPSTSEPETSHNINNNNNNNNNSGLHTHVRAAEDIEPYSPCSRVWVAAAVRPHYWSTHDSGFLALAIFFFFFLCCIQHASFKYMLCLLHFWLISSATYRPGIWTTACWVYGSVWT